MKMRDTIHGMIYLSPEEMEIINTWPFQRLRYIRQLATTYLVYPGAEHSRFGHSIGTMHIASRVIQSIKQKHQDSFHSDTSKQLVHWAWMEQMLRLMALTHDLGHPPFSHAGEDLLPDKKKHEDYTKEIILNSTIKEIISKIGQNFYRRYGTDEYKITAEAVVNTYLGKEIYSRDQQILNFLMDSELDCDKMDYLLRDSHYCGVNYGHYDLERLLTAIGLGNDIEDEKEKVVSIHEDGLHAFEEFVLARYFMFLQVYFHKTRRILDISLQKYLKKVLPDGHYPNSVQAYLLWDDNRVLQDMHNHKDIEEVAHFQGRRFPRSVYQTNAHAGSSDSEKYRRVKVALKKSGICPDEELIEDDASKLPHSIPSMLLSGSTGEKAVYLLRDDGSTTNIINASYVLNQIKESISIHRMYVPFEKKDQFREFIRNNPL
jgi:hypothetical protein